MHLRLFALITFLSLSQIWLATAENTNAVTVLWQIRLPGGGSESAPTLGLDGTVYQALFQGWLMAIAPNGEVKWKFKTGREIKSSPAIAEDGTIYAGSRDWSFYAITPDGNLKWKFTTGAWVDSSPAIGIDGTVYFGSWDKSFYALTPEGTVKWKYPTGNVIDSSPAIGTDGTVYFGSHDKVFYALAPDGKLKWKFDTGGEIESSPAISAEGTIYFTSTDGNFYALRPDGTEWWRLHTGGFIGSSPTIDEEGQIYLSINKLETSISREGKIRWQRGTEVPTETAPTLTANGYEYFSLPWLRLGAYDRAGNYQWEFIMRGNNLQSSPCLDPAGIIYTCDGISLFALKPITNANSLANSSWPMWRANPQHTGRVQQPR